MIRVLYEKAGQPVAAFVDQRYDDCLTISDHKLLKLLVTAVKIHAWTNVGLGGVRFYTILAMQTLPLRSPQLQGPPPVPLRSDDFEYPAEGREFLKKVHILADSDNDKSQKKFLRPGLYYSALFGKGTIVSYQGRIWIIPTGCENKFLGDLRGKGAAAFEGYESFEDPTVPYLDDKGTINIKGDVPPQLDGDAGSAARPSVTTTGISTEDAEEDAKILALLRIWPRNEVIKAVLARRRQNGWGLKEAKEYVEMLASRHGVAFHAALVGGAGDRPEPPHGVGEHPTPPVGACELPPPPGLPGGPELPGVRETRRKYLDQAVGRPRQSSHKGVVRITLGAVLLAYVGLAVIVSFASPQFASRGIIFAFVDIVVPHLIVFGIPGTLLLRSGIKARARASTPPEALPSAAPGALQIAPTPQEAAFLMPIEDWFVIKGRGTVVTGRVVQGSIRVGAKVCLVGRPGSGAIETVVQAIEAMNSRPVVAAAGDHVGLLLLNVRPEQVDRGMIVMSPDTAAVPAGNNSGTPKKPAGGQNVALVRDQGGGTCGALLQEFAPNWTRH